MGAPQLSPSLDFGSSDPGTDAAAGAAAGTSVMPGIGTVAGALGGAAIGALGNYFGQQATNSANMQMVQQQESYQTQMSNTAYQRAVADMKAAGINPMLAVSNGGASTPSGSIAPMTSPMQAAVKGAMDGSASALNAASTAAQIRQTMATTDKTSQEAKTSSAQADYLRAQAVQSGSSTALAEQQRKNEALRQKELESESRIFSLMNKGLDSLPNSAPMFLDRTPWKVRDEEPDQSRSLFDLLQP